jgi:hypothetical protein
MMPAVYHQATLDLIGLEVQPGEPNPALMRWATRHGHAVPASVKEWYSLPDAVALLFRYSNQDPPLEPGEFRVDCYQEKPVWTCIIENQGVCRWGIWLNGDDDPPVLVNITDSWEPCASTFSTFVYTRVFDYQYWADDETWNIEVRGPLKPGELRYLRTHFSEAPQTLGFPGAAYRFYQSEKRATLWISQDGEQTDWSVSARTPALFQELMATLKALWQGDA